MTPAERLLKAADLLDKQAGEATAGPWWTEERDPVRGLSVIQGGMVEQDLWYKVARDAPNSDAAYIATMHPEVGKGVATCLRGFGVFAAAFTGPDEEVDILGFDDALALADLVLAGESQ